MTNRDFYALADSRAALESAATALGMHTVCSRAFWRDGLSTFHPDDLAEAVAFIEGQGVLIGYGFGPLVLRAAHELVRSREQSRAMASASPTPPAGAPDGP